MGCWVVLREYHAYHACCLEKNPFSALMEKSSVLPVVSDLCTGSAFVDQFVPMNRSRTMLAESVHPITNNIRQDNTLRFCTQRLYASKPFGSV